ncbi:CI116-like protein [Mya arenaria]|uniref:CI116-like protein n=1 Tax=Mya arenaria TaxID=6604 RepID=A0ABY7FU64_MYAAR|nr:piercer of microtubule wall 1 protein-like [Mya arenaria]XP_052781627.1 piercer of microtubule wall 1 protein-like [Mya arenaria]WAR25758.1 CI116-like protein [Mya arenaria]WAR25788.1 CI116-like protein [Mya arenaria]
MSGEQAQASQQMENGIPKGSKTSDYYKTSNIPNRFENPDWFQGYGGKTQHPMYRTTAATYGAKTPSVHTMPTSFHCRSQKFSEHLGTCGMYRNHSLNTNLDTSNV